MPTTTTRRRRGRLLAATACAATAAAMLLPVTASAVTGDDGTSTTSYGFVAKVSSGGKSCSGVLIGQRWVLTSSTCFPDTTNIGAPAQAATVTVGRTDLTTTTGDVVQVDAVIPRPDRNLALVRLATAVTDVTPIALATQAPQAGDTLRLAGFGRTATDWVPDQLHTTAVTIDSVTATTLGVGSASGHTTCKGDAGGPAIRVTSGTPELVALNHASWQNGCLGETETRTGGATEARTDDLHDWLTSQITSPIVSLYLDKGGAASPLGTPVGTEYTAAGGTAQNYTKGAIYTSTATGTHDIEGQIYQHYVALGGPDKFGLPTTGETATPDNVGRYNHFALNASIYYSPSTGAHEVEGQIRAKWAALGWETGIGYPTTDQAATTDGVGRYNNFSVASASIYWSPNTGAHEIQGTIHDKWLALGGVQAIGYPTTDESTTPDGVGKYNHFSLADGASIYWSPATSAHEIQGTIRTTWANLGWETSRLAYPTSDEYAVTGGRRNDFQHGNIFWNSSNGATQVTYS